MSHSLEQQLNESLRDAMLAYYLTHKVPAALKTTISTADDLYAHWLLDVQVSQAVPTSPIACAVSSLQQYISRIELGLEPGYEHQGMTAQQGSLWREQLHTYPLWHASQQLRYHPANYLDPTLRRDKTDSFQQLENDLSQYRIQADTVATAVQHYLARFEEIANIRTINGYIDADLSKLHSGTYYFVGKSSSENTYYWRTLHLSRRSGAVLLPGAWSDWKKINLSVSDATAEQSIRPVYFNGRLFFIWAECIKPTPSSSFKPAQSDSEDEEYLDDWINTHYVKFRLNFSYKKHDDSWSVPQACIEQHCATEDVNASSAELLKSITQTVAIVDSSSSTPVLFLSVLATSRKDPKQQGHFIGKFFQAVHLDQSFNITTVADGGSPERYRVRPGSKVAIEINRLLETFDPSQKTKVRATVKGETPHTNGYYNELLPDSSRQFLTLFAHKNEGNLQFKIAPAAEHTITITSQKVFNGLDDWNFENKQTNIKDTDNTNVFFDSNTQELVFSSVLKEGFKQPYAVTLTKQQGTTITLMTNDTLDDSKKTWVKLSKGSAITGASTNLQTDLYALYLKNPTTQEEFPNAIYDAEGALFTPVVDPKNAGNLLLENKFIDKSAFVDLYTNKSFHIALNRYGFYNNEGRGKKLHSQNVLLVEKAEVSTVKLRAYKHVIMSANFKKFPFTETVSANSHRIINFQDTDHESLTGSSPELPAGHRVTTRLPVTQQQLTSGITLVHGVVTFGPKEESTKILGNALNTATLKLTTHVADPALNQQLAPTIKRLESDTGIAEFMDFSNNSASLPEGMPTTLRMNTCFAAKLVQAANISLERLFSLTPETWQEPPLTPGGTAEGIDFKGANGKYFWELFLYVPWLIAHRLNQEQQYAQAQAWLGYLFDPGRAADASGHRPAFWGLRELTRNDRLPGYTSHDPHKLAIHAPVHFRKAIYRFYLDILLNRGDAYYRQLTPDSLTQAKLWYTRVRYFLGARPKVITTEPWAQITLATLATQGSDALKEFEQTKPKIDVNLSLEGDARPWLPATDNLRLAFNAELVTRWDKLDSRLHNLRHNLDITGKPLRLPLYAAPLSPLKLMASQGKGAFGESHAASFIDAQVGHYRFQVMLNHALTATEAVIQFGNTVLTLIERKEQAEYLELQQQQAWDLANIVVTQQTQALQVDANNRQALHASRRMIESRMHYYTHQLTESISPGELQAGALYLTSTGYDTAACVAAAGAGIAMVAPNIFGTSVGGSRWEGPFYAAQAIAQGVATALRGTAADLDRSEQFNRRAQEWAHAQDQARLELAQVDAQLNAYAEQEKATRLQLRLAETSLAQAWSNYQLLAKRYSKAQLYDWLNAQLSTFYYQVYDLSLSLCRTAQACWHYEVADYERTFIQPGAWNNNYRGYLAGEALKLSLLNMNTAYLNQNVRDLEIVKTISLRHRLNACELSSPSTDTSQTPPSPPEDKWVAHKRQLVNKGTLCFKLPAALFEEDYPGHILRRIKGISVSLPATLGPYEDIKAILTQTRNEIVLPTGQVRTDMRAHQQIALSTGLDDNGLFTLTFDSNERYLPFEYTGAISDWTLEFPNPDRQKAALESINDIVIHLRYTARATAASGGKA
ncbi:neuraminidase-like domain-containing protein [Pseudomonas sp. MUP55]|uniref:Tc toxin subunit A-related protein n=1 Tax=Pseudomonas sp. MUP55 TaxID=3087234 RepID=UPI002A5AD32E|nr:MULTISPECIES: neuraminidase-like domain-containing protein [unclassified Pseudomonas]WPN91084.1 neuraminidase-like domain-containing protein [Pseudomonas sp. MUP56]WPN96610.1 neuraminidase-like domain-containing protein [Pseudomonas sp. MUP55]